MSDEQQTPEGARFWTDRLAEASTGNYDVGLVDFGRNYVEWWYRLKGDMKRTFSERQLRQMRLTRASLK
jgi:hypothetical protein